MPTMSNLEQLLEAPKVPKPVSMNMLHGTP